MKMIINTEFTAQAQEDDKNIEAVYVCENNEYIVEKHNITGCSSFYCRLAIKRSDKTVIRSWRLIQDVKNAVVGEDSIAIEVYPKESDVTDTANMYHLWVYKNGEKPNVSIVP